MKTRCVYEAPDHQMALEAQAFLESNGIPCMLPNEHHGSLQPYLSLALGSRILVREEDAEEAVALISAFLEAGAHRNEVFIEATGAEGTDITRILCPHCGSTRVVPGTKTRGVLSLLLFSVFALPVPVRKRITTCLECGKTWKTGKPGS